MTHILTVDAVILTDGGIVMMKRKYDPFKGYWALPGGHVEDGETVEQAIIREVKEETNLDIEDLELTGVYSLPKRDPRGYYVSIAFYPHTIKGTIKGSHEGVTKVFKLNDLPKNIAFDHRRMIEEAGCILL